MTLLQRPFHPGAVLTELYLTPIDMSVTALARRLNVPRSRIARLARCEASLSVDTAIRLATFFRTTPEYWMNLQRAWDLARARDTIDVSDITPLEAA